MSRTVLDPSLTPSVQPNIIDNGGFEVWQRGTSFSNPASGTFTADRWYITKSGTPTINVTQNSTAANVDSGLYSLKFDITALGSGFGEAYVQTNVENPLAYASKTLTVSVRVKASVANLFRVTINDGSGFAVSSYHPGDGAFHTLSATFTPGSTPSQINVRIGVVVGDTIQVSTAYFDSVMLTFGSAVPSFIPINPKEDLERCQRYYQVATQSSAGGGGFGTTQVHLVWLFKVSMRAAPTITFNTFSINLLEPNANFAASSPSIIGAVGTDGVSFVATISGGTNAAGASLASGSITASADL